MIDKDILNDANEWFKLHNIPTFIHGTEMYIEVDGLEFQLSSAEVLYRAESYWLTSKENDLTK